MLLLAIESSAASVSVALMSGKKVLAARFEQMERGQGEALIPLIQSVLSQSNVNPADLNAVAVGVGPGSFTGVRVGLSAARAIGLALSVPVMGVTNFEAAAFGIAEPVVVVLDTKRGDYYTQLMNNGLAQGSAMICDAQGLKKYLPFTAVGDGAPAVQAEIGCHRLENNEIPAVCVGQVALTRLDHPLPAEPFYLRGADVSL